MTHGLSYGDWFLLALSTGYFGAAIAYFVGGNKGYAIACAAWGIGNIALIWAAK